MMSSSDEVPMAPGTVRRPLVEGAGPLKTLLVMIYCHFSVSLLCLNVMFDLLLFGAPVFLLHKIGLLSNKAYLAVTTSIINWTSPIVFAMPMVFSGSKLYCNSVGLLVESKSADSLLLSNHGSRIDWMVGMFVGYSKSLHPHAAKACERVRVGFVCEAAIQFMPIIGWYRKIVAKDVFVWRSFKQDSSTIKQNIADYHSANERRMLFLSPEGIVVDFGQKDMEYISECRQFCIEQAYKPFDYVLTPRYKGSMCLLQQVEKTSGPIISVCVAYVRGGKLLNCSLFSPDRVIPDLYTLNQGVGGSPVDVYIHLKRLHIAQDTKDPKRFMMNNYQEKDEILAEWDKQLSGTSPSKAWMSQFTQIQSNYKECVAYQLGHTALMIVVAILFGHLYTLFHVFGSLFCLVAGCHTVGWALNSTSMDSVPFETGIKAIAQHISAKKRGESVKSI